jgi:hypothetical protein
VRCLVALDYVQQVDAITYALTPLGHAKRDGMAARIQQFEEAKLAPFDGARILEFRQFLSSLLKK